MESATLNKAHDHVRNAATATFGNSIAAAGAEHEYAASAFREAAQDTHNEEALRILALLQDHHHKLARLIKEPPRKKEKKSDATEQASESATTSPLARRDSVRTSSPSPSTSSPTRAPSRRRLPQSSIASNLAEKRGIPGSRRGTSTVSVTNALATRNDVQSTPVRDLLERQSRKTDPASTRNEKPEATPPRPNIAPPSDDNFRRFYSAFGGVISAISAPLAFTSLPLTLPTPTASSEQPPPPPDRESRPEAPEAARTIKSSEPDLAALISKPALRALREDNAGMLGPFANNESFYFVPTTGGTASYANIVRDPQAHPHHAAQNPHLDSIDENENESGLRGSSHEEFVDARESINPPSPTAPRRPRSKGSTTAGVTNARTIAAGRGTGQKTMEELALENDTLRNLIDKQAKRLSMWETTSQSSYNALAQSFRARSGGLGGKQLSDPSALAQALTMGSHLGPALPSPPMPSTSSQYQTQPASPSATTDKERRRMAELEAMVASQASRLSALEDEKQQLAHANEKHAQVIGRYREQWEKLKAGARKKEQERREKRVAELRAGDAAFKDSSSGEATGDGEEVLDEEPGFGKA
ncbi:hypothetical protein K504DRAFT_366446 [Pleomassaria siparia CBS 279.74]|uniref:Uncharacterized protein n=1 Tax=Pleomassaria siparia CBS 279.74 TaxID=1314801 RepID=A0A6G1KQD2_9PLEO|nr:hypothetical protein K504DRAFT_366446 [Pleomassaria siparia CBS 279.74]